MTARRGYMIGLAARLICTGVLTNCMLMFFPGQRALQRIATKADIAIIATAANGNKMTKNYRANYSIEGHSGPLTRILPTR